MQLEMGYNQIAAVTIASTAVGVANGVLSQNQSPTTQPTIANPGSEYNPGNVVTVAGGTYKTMLGTPASNGPAQFVVERTNPVTGAVISLLPVNSNPNYNGQGFYSAFPSNAAATTTNGAGTGLTLNLTQQSGVPPANANYTTIQAEAQNLRITGDGTTPTSTLGELILAGTSYPYYGNPANLQIICGDTPGGVANIKFYRI